jgi:hypothetical protein
MVKRITRIAQRKASVHHLKKALELIVLNGSFWKPFLPLPFTAESPPGKRIGEAWTEVKKTYPNSAIIQAFFWKFWRPKEDTQDAVFLGEIDGHAPMLARLALQAAGVQL